MHITPKCCHTLHYLVHCPHLHYCALVPPTLLHTSHTCRTTIQATTPATQCVVAEWGHLSSLPFLCTAAGLAWEMDQLHVCSTSTQNWDGEPHRALSVSQCKLIHSCVCINTATCCLLQGTPPGCREMSAAVLASQCCPTVHNGCGFLGRPRGAGERTFPSTLHHCLPCDASPPHQQCHTRCFISTAVSAVIQVLPTVIPPESSQLLHTS